jgi:glutathione peroxidase
MKKLFIFFIPLQILFAGCAEKKAGQQQAGVQNPIVMSDFYSFQLRALDGEEIDFSRYKGKKVLLVNVASECGYTPQYKDLQNLHEQFGHKVAVLGFPANNFGGQEPGTHQQIADFCQKNYGVDFQMFSKISVKGNDQHPLYEWLREQTGQEPSWNFSKYLVDENGEVIAFYPSDVNPMDKEIVDKVRN